jgi:hypothetical protein
MPRESSIRNTLFLSTVRVVIESRFDASGTSILLPDPDVATAFAVQVGKGDRIYLATPAHVVERADRGTLLFLRPHASGGESRLYEYSRSRFGEFWWYPKSLKGDVAITPLSFGEIADQLAIHDAQIVATPFWDHRADDITNPRIRFVHAFEDVLFVGYPLGIWDPMSGSPIVRRGVTATPSTGTYHGEPAFLLDVAVYRGSSGSPVLVMERELIIPRDAGTSWGQRIREEERVVLLGMIIDILEKKLPGLPIAGVNLAIVLRADVIFDVIAEYERFTAQETGLTSQ